VLGMGIDLLEDDKVLQPNSSLGSPDTRSAALLKLMRRRNSYEIVAGTVAKVAVMRARTYVNFGADWRNDFTAGIEARVLRANPEWAKTLTSLEGKRVEVRGWIQYRNGPYIDIEDPTRRYQVSRPRRPVR
jgi:hypothetical protein